jgi:DNA primase large subunit
MKRRLEEIEENLPHLRQNPQAEKVNDIVKQIQQRRNHHIQTNSINYNSKEKLNLKIIEHLVSSFPLCMSQLHTAELKYDGRRQYGPFIKAIGIPFQDALQYFKKHFETYKPKKGFASEYKYFVEYLYGKQGSKREQTPLSCQRIMGFNPPKNDQLHGCPYKHETDSNLEDKLSSRYQLTSEQVNEIMTLKKKKNYGACCQKFFNYKHPNAPKKYLLQGHPNDYFQASQDYYKDQNKD